LVASSLQGKTTTTTYYDTPVDNANSYIIGRPI
jgi:hypothetical protein